MFLFCHVTEDGVTGRTTYADGMRVHLFLLSILFDLCFRFLTRLLFASLTCVQIGFSLYVLTVCQIDLKGRLAEAAARRARLQHNIQRCVSDRLALTFTCVLSLSIAPDND